jgi:hypothetical protein
VRRSTSASSLVAFDDATPRSTCPIGGRVASSGGVAVEAVPVGQGTTLRCQATCAAEDEGHQTRGQAATLAMLACSVICFNALQQPPW